MNGRIMDRYVRLRALFEEWLESKGLWYEYIKEWGRYHSGDGWVMDEWFRVSDCSDWLMYGFDWSYSSSGSLMWGELNNEWLRVLDSYE